MRTFSLPNAAILLAAALLANAAVAQSVPPAATYQGRLTDTSGNNMPDGTGYSIEARIWSASTGGTLIWGARYDNVPLKGGAFSLVLGASGATGIAGASITDLSKAFASNDRYLGLTVTKNAIGGSIGSPTELLPRQQWLSSPYAFLAANAALVNTDGVLSAAIKDGEVKTADIATDAVTNAKIATGAVNANSIAASVITSSHIASTAINPDRLNQLYGFYYHEVAANTDAPSPIPGWQARTLNGGTNSIDTSIARTGNTITLQPGTYYIEAEAFIYRANGHQLIVRDVTAAPSGNPSAAEAVLRGAANWSPTLSQGNSPISSTAATVKGYVTVATTPKKFELWHYLDSNIASTFGMGASVSSGIAYRPVTLSIVRIK